MESFVEVAKLVLAFATIALIFVQIAKRAGWITDGQSGAVAAWITGIFTAISAAAGTFGVPVGPLPVIDLAMLSVEDIVVLLYGVRNGAGLLFEGGAKIGAFKRFADLIGGSDD